MIATKPGPIFTKRDFEVANNQWGCNCGPSAIAAVLGLSLDEVGNLMKPLQFHSKRFTNPTMARGTLRAAGVRIRELSLRDREQNVFPRRGLVQIQWTGPWTREGANKRWAYMHTHWIAAWETMRESGYLGEMQIFTEVFDCNVIDFVCPLNNWQLFVAPKLAASIPRGDLGWFIKHSWEIES